MEVKVERDNCGLYHIATLHACKPFRKSEALIIPDAGQRLGHSHVGFVNDMQCGSDKDLLLTSPE